MISDFTFTDRARPVVEIGVGDEHGINPVAVWDAAHWDVSDAYWAGVEPTWLDVSCDVVRYECAYGRAMTIERFLPGTADVLVDNTSGWADPSHDATPNKLAMRPGRQIRMGIVHRELGEIWLWRGYIDGIVPIYDPVQPDTVELHCIDALGEVNRAKSKPLAAPIGAGDTGTVRFHRLLDNALWPITKRDAWATADRMIATDLGGQTADLLGVLSDSCGGAVFADTDNVLCFRGRDWQAYHPDVPVDGSIGNSADAGTGNPVVYVDAAGERLNYVWSMSGTAEQVIFFEVPGADDVCPVRWERPFERADISTRAIMGRDADTAVQLDDADGIIRYGIEPFERTSLITEADSGIVTLAERVLEVRNESTAPHIRSVTLNAATADDSLDMQATVSPFKPSRYHCRLIDESRGEVFDEEHFVTGVRHIIDRHSWETLINLDLAAPYANIGAHWDGALWDHNVWADVVFALLDEARSALADHLIGAE